jgi:hypothetical protein
MIEKCRYCGNGDEYTKTSGLIYPTISETKLFPIFRCKDFGLRRENVAKVNFQK